MPKIPARHVFAAGASALFLSLVAVATAHAEPTPPEPPKPVELTLHFQGAADDETRSGAEAEAKAVAAQHEKQFTDATKATCVDKSTEVKSNKVADDRYVAFAVTTSVCTIPPPMPASSQS
ncbi:hypothetical protein ABZ345_44650 [Lentzea sp. NPDC005914]|uniref:hypothetical protein n=1 Tax=Lentzea sp. NPDC005914 TaxID=3154572 RepID=UPI003406FB36